MIEVNSPMLQLRYEKLRQDATNLFDLQWLRDETASLLMQQFPTAITSPWQAMHQWDQLCHTDHLAFFAHQLLTTYPAAHQQVEAIVDQDMPIEMLEDELNEQLWNFATTNAGKCWILVSARDDAQKRSQTWKQSAKTIYKKCRIGEDVQTFFLLFNTISILNDVMHGKARQHGLQYTKKSTRQTDDPVDAFCQQLLDIVNALARMNGTLIKTNAKGVTGEYTFHIDAGKFGSMMQELKTEFRYKLEDYLGERNATQAIQLSLVAPFLGYVLNTHLISSPQIQKTDIAQVLHEFYPQSKNPIVALSKRSELDAEQSLFRMAETLLDEKC